MSSVSHIQKSNNQSPMYASVNEVIDLPITIDEFGIYHNRILDLFYSLPNRSNDFEEKIHLVDSLVSFVLPFDYKESFVEFLSQNQEAKIT